MGENAFNNPWLWRRSILATVKVLWGLLTPFSNFKKFGVLEYYGLSYCF